jgi:hypothetical protein
MKYQLIYREHSTFPFHVIDSANDVDQLKTERQELIKSRKYIGFGFYIIDCDTLKYVR